MGALAVTIILLPVFLLFLVTTSRLEMASVVLVFVIAFWGLMSTVTQATDQEVLFGTIA